MSAPLMNTTWAPNSSSSSISLSLSFRSIYISTTTALQLLVANVPIRKSTDQFVERLIHHLCKVFVPSNLAWKLKINNSTFQNSSVDWGRYPWKCRGRIKSMKNVTEPDIKMLKPNFCEDIICCMRIIAMIESRFRMVSILRLKGWLTLSHLKYES